MLGTEEQAQECEAGDLSSSLGSSRLALCDLEILSHQQNDLTGTPEWFSDSVPQGPRGTAGSEVEPPGLPARRAWLWSFSCIGFLYQISFEKDSVALKKRL